LYEHNIAHSTYTSTGVPWGLKYTEVFSSLPEAKNREREIKNRKSRIYFESLIVDGALVSLSQCGHFF
jgi:putative endonuclease